MSYEMVQEGSPGAAMVKISGLTLCHDERILIGGINLDIAAGEIFAIIGASGCGKSTLLHYLMGLESTSVGTILLNGYDINGADEAERKHAREQFGVLFQGGALWTTMNLAENVALPLENSSNFTCEERLDIARLKLSMVGLSGFESFFPHELSGGMIKRAGIARAMVCNPAILFFDEPSAGLDPITSRKLDDLILRIRRNRGVTFILVTHELESIFSIADRVAFFDPDSHSVLDIGNPHVLAQKSSHAKVRHFFASNKLQKTTPLLD
ncbi:MAG: ATP-binding cassette domain-containing protein [Puniceicoccales bacterium]|jgi:phospholipid/cholesterol/gamma-HCH transport system ATP-binding protein|nr:ATP-binding cassette domain-containing protein [Puniceicoccales bacterium]